MAGRGALPPERKLKGHPPVSSRLPTPGCRSATGIGLGKPPTLVSDLRTFCGKSDRRTDILDPALITRILQPGEQSFVVSVVRLEPYSFECTKHHDFPGRGACILHDLH